MPRVMSRAILSAMHLAIPGANPRIQPRVFRRAGYGSFLTDGVLGTFGTSSRSLHSNRTT